MKQRILLLFFCGLSVAAHSQLALSKMVGKNSDKVKLGYGFFSYYDIPLNEERNKSFRIELLDLAFFPAKTSADASRAYLSIKLGYKQ
jgi:hypothetical protein